MVRRKLFQSSIQMTVKFVASAQSDELPAQWAKERGRKENAPTLVEPKVV